MDNSGILNESAEANTDESRSARWLTFVIATIGLISLATIWVYVFMQPRPVENQLDFPKESPKHQRFVFQTLFF